MTCLLFNQKRVRWVQGAEGEVGLEGEVGAGCGGCRG